MSIDDLIKGENMSNELGVGLFDIHFPEQDKKAMKAVESYMAQNRIDSIVYGGDFLDMAPVSHWLKNKRRALESKRLLKDYDGFNEMLAYHAKISGCKQMDFLEGNHEAWVDQLIESMPEIEGFLEVENNLEIPKGVKSTWTPLNKFLKKGKLYFTHGLYTNLHHAKKTVDNVGRSIVYGHVHDFQSHTKISPLDVKDKHKAQSIGCLTNLNPSYMKNRPNNWSHGFLIYEINKKSGRFNTYPVEIVNGEFSHAGKVYSWRDKIKK